jgi:hypothetical protein
VTDRPRMTRARSAIAILLVLVTACGSSGGADPSPSPTAAPSSEQLASSDWQVWVLRNLPTWRRLERAIRDVHGPGINLDAMREVERLVAALDPMPDREAQRHLVAFRRSWHDAYVDARADLGEGAFLNDLFDAGQEMLALSEIVSGKTPRGSST